MKAVIGGASRIFFPVNPLRDARNILRLLWLNARDDVALAVYLGHARDYSGAGQKSNEQQRQRRHARPQHQPQFVADQDHEGAF